MTALMTSDYLRQFQDEVRQFRRDPFQVRKARVPVSCVFRLPRVFLNRRGDVLFR